MNVADFKLCVVASRGLVAMVLACVCLSASPTVGQTTNTDTWHWMTRGTQSPPAARDGVLAVWTGTRMLIWGGQPSGAYNFVNTGCRYDPMADSWSPMSVTNAPSARNLCTAIWTGREMIVWGGAPATGGGNACLNTGARYDPVSDTWHTVTTVGAPQSRLAHTAVWTGKEMIIWGGNNYSQDFNNGGRYDPATDTWKPITIVHAPAARSSMTAVWTGQEMVIWGGNYMTCSGYNCQLHYPPDSARYSPDADAWVTNTTTGAPALWADFSAVWDGTEVIVWGGYNGSTYGGRTCLNTGGRFNPIAGTWTPVSSLQAPVARDQHLALWTGEKMIIWGGTDRSSALRNGGRYRPASDTWIAGTTNGASLASYAGEAVWTGEAMLVYNDTLSAYHEPGLYAWDGLPNDWQRHFFGENNPQASPLADPDGDHQNNWTEYIAGTDPTNASSRLSFAIFPSLGQTRQSQITFSPCTAGRVYTLLTGTNMNVGAFVPIFASFTNIPAAGGAFAVTNATPRPQFFRLQVGLP